ncbi:Rut operon repressor [Tritonibacter multivorans]|uniref:Rut operon repressor n=1 Tax=Tritonibacter multivorans TaxID=928856 RepID=A0A0P1GE73_9RHOB|nr:TetR family transcriptional regulator C-terminal domain-containing protein [Tritonibacter multivorans]MDA7422947.1 TetR family transcriptional regulator C-terminal domain-containing protein [Tritonibacter multivorans]CUH74660.1 Rut operon repressor [Tritonibacter multivorans]SFD72512.1 transcriptional regulator, TetR family [Tritonibacter multivorans]
MTGPKTAGGYSRIQTQKRAAIFAAALEIFARHGLRGASLEAIAAEADMSKQNLLYYFDGKEAIFVELIQQLTDLWLEPLAQIDPAGEPVAEVLAYVQRKLVMSQNHPRESRLFATEILQGVPHIKHLYEGPMKAMVDRTVALLQTWMDAGQIRAVDPHDLLFSIWANTQHYADFSAQINLIKPMTREERYANAERFLTDMYRALLVVQD